MIATMGPDELRKWARKLRDGISQDDSAFVLPVELEFSADAWKDDRKALAEAKHLLVNSGWSADLVEYRLAHVPNDT